MEKANWDMEFSKIVEQNKTCLYEICKSCMRQIEKDTETAQEGFEYFLTRIPLPRYNSDELPDTLFDVNEDEIDTPTQDRIHAMESQIVKELIFQDVSAETFYTEIWRRFSDKLLVSDSYQKSFFLLRMWMDPRIPYYQLGLGVRMDNKAYRECVKQVMIPYRKMLFAMNAGYPQQTQKASIIMQLADEIPDQNQRIVFWALTLRRLEKQIAELKQHIQELSDAIEELDDMETEY